MPRIEPRLRHALAVLLAGGCMASHAALPNWVHLGESGGARVFIDASQAEHPPGYLKLWTLLDYPRMQRGGWRSEQRLFLFSCKDRALQWQQSIYFAAGMAEGSPVDLRVPRRDDDPVSLAGKKQAVPEADFISAFEGMC